MKIRSELNSRFCYCSIMTDTELYPPMFTSDPTMNQ